MSSVMPRIKVFAVYRRKNKWRGFCSPYDVSCYAPTMKEAGERLESLVDLYEKGLAKYNYPPHLSVKNLSDPEDQNILEALIDEVTKGMRHEMKKDFAKYQLRKQERHAVRAEGASGYFVEPAIF